MIFKSKTCTKHTLDTLIRVPSIKYEVYPQFSPSLQWNVKFLSN